MAWDPSRSEPQREGDRVVLAIDGEVDSHNADDLAAVLMRALEQRPAKLVVDLAGVTFCGSAGIRCLLVVNQAAREAGVVLLVSRPSVAVERVVELAGVDQVLVIDRG